MSCGEYLGGLGVTAFQLHTLARAEISEDRTKRWQGLRSKGQGVEVLGFCFKVDGEGVKGIQGLWGTLNSWMQRPATHICKD